jgi:hypothetical protein
MMNHFESTSTIANPSDCVDITTLYEVPFESTQIIDIVDFNDKDSSAIAKTVIELEDGIPNMWSWDYIGLYSCFAAVGFLCGTVGTSGTFCVYVFGGSPNVCANAPNLMLFAWNFKIVFALITDSYRPFGLRRRPWMIFGFSSVLFILAISMITAESLTASNWLILLLFMNIGLMFADVPADGYSVQIGIQDRLSYLYIHSFIYIYIYIHIYEYIYMKGI